ncbi:c-type cytochrome [Blattabacterium cuenoti]|uniref:c-type cytochrome n=1 Tax=Blattabacterium cuenoti TaxID=1653831 RepID=UPI00163CF661|nr:c-type cytochrome [Blattabacterium cuenoti]
MNKKQILILFIFFQCLFFSNIKSENVFNGNAENGKDLFKKNCTSCHSIELEKKMIGPALSGITTKRSREWLHKWIKNNKSLRESGDKEAQSIYKEYGNIEMNSFPKLSEQEIDDILFFTKKPLPIKEEKKITNQNNFHPKFEEIEEKNFLTKLFIFCFGILFVILTWTLYKVQILIRLINEKKEKSFIEHTNFFVHILYKKILGRKKISWYLFSSLLIVFIILSIYGMWSFAMKIDVNKGYEPSQPIYFSHKIHSGINKIDCQYCHSSAKYGKVAGIPSTNICMNCHITIDQYKGNYIEVGKTRDEYNKEIHKIYHSIGWNSETRKYINKKYPIKWIRIHNMPDFVYFDHSQHIISGNKSIKNFKKVDLICNACHGKVQEMDQIKMTEDFTMEWCITCHRNVSIDQNNQYYKKYFLNKKTNPEKITVDMIGGTECAKCHY